GCDAQPARHRRPRLRAAVPQRRPTHEGHAALSQEDPMTRTTTPPVAGGAAAPPDGEGTRALSMQRSVTQLLFSYLPGRYIDWEEGIGIVALSDVVFARVWSATNADLVLQE